MAQVKILTDGPYLDFSMDSQRGHAIDRHAGDEIDAPDWYAKNLIGDGMATAIIDEPLPTPVPEPVKTPTRRNRRTQG